MAARPPHTKNEVGKACSSARQTHKICPFTGCAGSKAAVIAEKRGPIAVYISPQVQKSSVLPPAPALEDVACSMPPRALPVSPGNRSSAVPSVRDLYPPAGIIALGPGVDRQIHGGTAFGL